LFDANTLGSPWSWGSPEVHRSLLVNGLRESRAAYAPMGLKTGWDVLMAALPGAEDVWLRFRCR